MAIPKNDPAAEAVTAQWKNQTDWLEAQKDGEFFLAIQRFDKAEEAFLAAINKAAPFGGRDARLARSKTGLARTYTARRRWSDAISQYQEALSIKKKSYGDDHIDVADILNEMAFVQVCSNEYAQAKRTIEEASSTWKHLKINNPPELLMVEAIIDADEQRNDSADRKFKSASTTLLTQIDVHKFPQPIKSMRTARECIDRYSDWLQSHGKPELAKEYKTKLQPINDWLITLGESGV